jgi:hypothetical protein
MRIQDGRKENRLYCLETIPSKLKCVMEICDKDGSEKRTSETVAGDPLPVATDKDMPG